MEKRENKVALSTADPLGGVPVAYRLGDIFTQFNHMLDNLYGSMDAGIFADIQPKGTFPKIDVVESEKDFTVEVAIAGYNKDEVKLELKDNCLFIGADKTDDKKSENDRVLMREISRRSFRRVIRFPAKIDTESVTGSYENGIITCVIGKKIATNDGLVEIKIS